MIDQPEGDCITLTSIMRKVASNVGLKSLEIVVKNTRWTKAGGILLEVDTDKDADRLPDCTSGAVGISTRVGRSNRYYF